MDNPYLHVPTMELPVEKRVDRACEILENAFWAWRTNAWNPLAGDPCTSESIRRAASSVRLELKEIRDTPGFNRTFALTMELVEDASGARPTKSKSELHRRAQALIYAKIALEAYQAAFMAGQDNPARCEGVDLGPCTLCGCELDLRTAVCPRCEAR